MGGIFFGSPAAIARTAVSALAVLITLATGIYFNIKAPDNNNSIVQEWSAKDGRDMAYMTSSGALTASGAMTLVNLSAHSGQAVCIKTGGTLGYCSTTPTNGTCTCN